MIFRGISDSQYNLAPSITRVKNYDNETECGLITDFLTRRPDAFEGLSSFDKIAKMQHYGLPTRLLDFTLNPLVALYFACEKNKSKNGRVICHNTYLYNDTSPYVKSICEAAVNKPIDDNFTVDEYICNDELKLLKYLYQSYLYGETFVVKPKYWNKRIANQSGLFMVFPNHLRDGYKNVLVEGRKIGFEKAMKDCIHRKVENDKIAEIFNIEPVPSDAFYLTDEDFKSKVEAYKNKSLIFEEFAKFFEDRFTVSCELKELGSNLIKNDFCSIIIESKSKRKILKDLSRIGISADYIYPELEYTAKEIRRRYE